MSLTRRSGWSVVWSDCPSAISRPLPRCPSGPLTRGLGERISTREDRHLGPVEAGAVTPGVERHVVWAGARTRRLGLRRVLLVRVAGAQREGNRQAPLGVGGGRPH